jgi:haloacetate dehalogenase
LGQRGQVVCTRFRLCGIEVAPGITLRVRLGGSGPPLRLHGNPQAHLMWDRVAPQLAERFTVVCPDPRGYGFRLTRPPSANHAGYAQRAMAADLVALIVRPGAERFRLIGLDRGARVGHHLFLDHPERAKRAALRDIIPTLEHVERTNMSVAMGYFTGYSSLGQRPSRRP